MRLGELFVALSEVPQYIGCDAQTIVAELAVDSRDVSRGDVFLALRGATHDAHAYIHAVYAAGAACIIVQRDALANHEIRGPHVVLPDAGTAYPKIAAAAFGWPSHRLRMAAITGTNGKTTTAYLISSILEAAGHPHARLGTGGNWIVDHEVSATLTTPFPLELQRLLAAATTAGATHAIMEASSHALVQQRLQPLTFCAVGFTSFSQDHLDFHHTMAAYLAAKCRLVSEYLEPGGLAVAAVDDNDAATTFLATAPTSTRQWRVSRGQVRDAEIVAHDIRYGPDHTEAQVETPSGTFHLQSPLIAAFNLDNLLVAVGLALGLGVPLAAIAAALPQCQGAPGRLERIRVAATQGPAVVVDYAHTPMAVRRAIAAVRTVCPGRIWIVMGCGGDRDPHKRGPMGAIAARDADRFIATSDNPRTEDPKAILKATLAEVAPEDQAKTTAIVDRAEAIAYAIAQATPEDLVLVAGKGHETYQVLGTTQVPFDDRDHARAALLRRT